MTDKPETPQPLAWIHGLPITVSAHASDLLAAFHLGAQTVLATLAPQSVAGRQPEQVVVPGQEEDEEWGIHQSLGGLWSLDPVRREALLSQYGLTVQGVGEAEPDRTAENLRHIMEQNGITTEPQPGGAKARARKPEEEEEEHE